MQPPAQAVGKHEMILTSPEGAKEVYRQHATSVPPKCNEKKILAKSQERNLERRRLDISANSALSL
jgi:hypothetical protein